MVIRMVKNNETRKVSWLKNKKGVGVLMNGWK
jgi:hypothetical protein